MRARVVASSGDDTVLERFTAVRREVLGRERDAEVLRTEIRDMRERMRNELSRGGHGRSTSSRIAAASHRHRAIRHPALGAAHPALLYWTDNIRLLQTLEDTGLSTEHRAHHDRLLPRLPRPRCPPPGPTGGTGGHRPGQDFAAERAAVRALWDRLIGSADSLPQ